MANEDERRLILDMIDSGKITAEEGLRLLQTLPQDLEGEAAAYLEDRVSGEAYAAEATAIPAAQVAQEIPRISAVSAASAGDGYPRAASPETQDGDVLVGEVKPSSPPPDFERWRGYWMIPLWIGVSVAVLGALLMYWAQQASGMGFWFLCAGVPFTLGVLMMVFAWYSRTAHWLHLRIHQSGESWPRLIAFSFPLPLGLVGWGMRTFGVRLPGMETTSVDDLITIIKTSTSPDNPLFIEVEDDEDGDRVQIYIG